MAQDHRDPRDRHQDQRQEQEQAPRLEPVDPAAWGYPARPVTDLALVAEVVENASAQGLNVLAPITRLAFMPPDFQAAIRIVRFPMDGDWRKAGGKYSNGTWYEEEGGYALHKGPLRMLAAAAGASWTTERTDDRASGALWEFRATVRVRTMDGTWRQVDATKDLDLRDGSPVIESWIASATAKGRDGAANRILKAREVGGRVTEAKAVNAAIRDALGVRACYTEAQALRPFLFPFLVYVPSTPEARQLQAAVELGVVAQVYGPASRGKAYAPAGTVIDATDPGERAPDRRALPDHQGTRDAPDFRAETERLNQRQRVDRGGDDDLPGEDEDRQEAHRGRQGPPSSGRPSGPPRDQERPQERQGPRGGGPVKCSQDGCGANVSDQVADYSRRRFNRVLCMDHQPGAGGRGGSPGRR
jgi:hypothetical protein